MEKLKEKFEKHVYALQDLICDQLKKIDPSLVIEEDLWKRTDFDGNEGGGGRTRAITGDIIENAGVNCSTIFGAIDPSFAKNLGSSSNQLWATGVSLIIHPRNPKVPTVHANFRLIHSGDKMWLGGGADLTPFYPFEDDFKSFHQVWKDKCDQYGVYKEFKDKCDTYFVNKHRDNEMRGIGGIFYDHFNSGNFAEDVDMAIDLSNGFIPSYFPIMEKRVNEEFTQTDEDFQLFRRGRYVEFNLLHDRGTLFGLKTNGRTDSILISLPARCSFSYKFAPEERTPHATMMEYYKPKDWV